MNNIKFDFNDILLTPSVRSQISSRKEINPFDKLGFLPIITAPMDTVVNNKNKFYFTDNKINVCFPRNTQDFIRNDSLRFSYSFSLTEFKNCILQRNLDLQDGETSYILIDIANGHTSELINVIKEAKQKFGSLIFLIVGNVANPDTYHNLSLAGADAIRVGIGNGNGCLTTQQTGVGYPMGSLIQECRDLKGQWGLKSLIIADGGMKDYSDIIKALALGADYVMLGSILNKALESCGETKLFKYFTVSPYGNIAKFALKHKLPLTKSFRGMSTKEVQKSWGVKELKTSEGVVRTRPVEYTLQQWTNNFESYLRSAMSYCNATNLKEFIGEVGYERITQNAFNRFNK